MSDLTLGAIIAGITGLLGALIGGGIASVNNWIQVKSQIREAKIGRLIKSRETFLIPLRESLSQYLSNSIKMYSSFAIYDEQKKQALGQKTSSTPFETYLKTLEIGAKLMEKIETFSWQSSDVELRKLIFDLKNKDSEIGNAITQHAKWFATDYPQEGFREAVTKLNSAVSNQSDRLIPINKRIEELLSGDE